MNKSPVQKRMCKTCPFRDSKEALSEFKDFLAARALLEATPVGGVHTLEHAGGQQVNIGDEELAGVGGVDSGHGSMVEEELALGLAIGCFDDFPDFSYHFLLMWRQLSDADEPDQLE